MRTTRGRRIAGGAAIGLLGLTSLAVAAPASAADETSTVSSTVRWSPSPADLSKFGPNGGTISFTLTPSYVEGSAQEVRACGYDPEQIVPTTVSFEVSDLRPTDAYAGNPDLTYTRADGSLWTETESTSPTLERAGFGYQRHVRDLTKNVGYDKTLTSYEAAEWDPTVTEGGGALTTPGWQAPAGSFAGRFVATAVTTVTPPKGVERLPDFVELSVTPAFAMGSGWAGSVGPVRMLVHDQAGTPGLLVNRPEYTGVPLKVYWYATATASDQTPALSVGLYARAITGTVSCEREQAGGALVDPVVGSVGLGTAAVLAGAGLLHRRRGTAA
ncbi:hypothetical protein [Cellulosimicrobium sp. NPDC057862]|uniref:hypothetical protein n=1 Tax=Cellulosimicrobium sp. NPDC057862 TaxID=3346266 RepID=UPI0036732A4D